jgi:hypothetical protein
VVFNVAFKALDVCFTAPWDSTIEASPCRLYEFDWRFTYKHLHRDVKDKCSVVADSKAKEHDTSVAYVKIV